MGIVFLFVGGGGGWGVAALEFKLGRRLGVENV